MEHSLKTVTLERITEGYRSSIHFLTPVLSLRINGVPSGLQKVADHTSVDLEGMGNFHPSLHVPPKLPLHPALRVHFKQDRELYDRIIIITYQLYPHRQYLD